MLCGNTQKEIYNSEAAASRKVYQWEQIKRYYYCEHCGGWHITSKTRLEALLIEVRAKGLSIKDAVAKIKQTTKKTISIELVNNRILELQNLINEQK